MKRYEAADEEKVRLQGFVREWTRSGLLHAAQGERLAAELQVDYRRTGRVLRAGLALFTALIIGASVGLVIVLFDLSGDVAMGATTVVAGVICLTAADMVVVRFRFYRHGVEEMLAVGSCALMAIGAALLTGSIIVGTSRLSAGLIAALGVGALSSLFVYRRFGQVYAAIGSLACAALIPFQFSLAEPIARVLSASVLVATLLIARRVRRHHADDIAADDAAIVNAAAFAGLYLLANLYLTHHALDFVAAPYKWVTYGLIWVLPPCGLWVGIREKERWLIDVAAAAALTTLVTNKPYLGFVRRPWDPILFGVLLIGIAFGLRRWLARGVNGERAGFTSQRILASEDDLIRIAANASAGLTPRTALPSDQPQLSQFEGGRSGGGGASSGF